MLSNVTDLMTGVVNISNHTPLLLTLFLLLFLLLLEPQNIIQKESTKSKFMQQKQTNRMISYQWRDNLEQDFMNT
jgi:hypothetical protein